MKTIILVLLLAIVGSAFCQEHGEYYFLHIFVFISSFVMFIVAQRKKKTMVIKVHF